MSTKEVEGEVEEEVKGEGSRLASVRRPRPCAPDERSQDGNEFAGEFRNSSRVLGTSVARQSRHLERGCCFAGFSASDGERPGLVRQRDPTSSHRDQQILRDPKRRSTCGAAISACPSSAFLLRELQRNAVIEDKQQPLARLRDTIPIERPRPHPEPLPRPLPRPPPRPRPRPSPRPQPLPRP